MKISYFLAAICIIFPLLARTAPNQLSEAQAEYFINVAGLRLEMDSRLIGSEICGEFPRIAGGIAISRNAFLQLNDSTYKDLARRYDEAVNAIITQGMNNDDPSTLDWQKILDNRRELLRRKILASAGEECGQYLFMSKIPFDQHETTIPIFKSIRASNVFGTRDRNPSISNEASKEPEGSYSPPSVNKSTSDPSSESGKVTPSFDCINARTRSEHLICSSAELADGDVKITKQYKIAIESVSDKVSLKKNQNEWRKSIRDKCETIECVKSVQLQRIVDLSKY